MDMLHAFTWGYHGWGSSQVESRAII